MDIFNKLIREAILEENKNLKLFNSLITKWFGEINDQNAEKTTAILRNFVNIKDRLKLNMPEVNAFVTKFPRTFDPNNLKDITKYSLEQIKFLNDQFFDEPDPNEEVTDDPIFRGNDLPATPERIQASKNLWFGQKNLMVNENGFRIYAVPDRQTAINFGYYLQYLLKTDAFKNKPGHILWCISRPNINTNLWVNYRDRRTFYFVIDESKGEGNDKYLSALQYATDSVTNYRLTGIDNDGSDPTKNEEELYEIYPKLRGYLDLIKQKEFNGKIEVSENKEIVNRITEIPGDEYEYAIMSMRYKKQYIDKGKTLNRKKSWETTTPDLRKAYIDTIDKDNVYEKLSSQELLTYIQTLPNDVKSIDSRLKKIGLQGIVTVFYKLMKDNYIVSKFSIKNQNIVIFKNRINNTFGIYNVIEGKWVEKNGTIYYDSFTIGQRTTQIDRENKKIYYMHEYRSATDTFYTITPSNEISSSKCYIATRKAYDEIIEEFKSNPESIIDKDLEINEFKMKK
jgi:hypothetical protein